MSPGYATYAGFALLCLLLLVLPFVPAWQEWRRPTDADALPVSPTYSNDIDHFAKRLQADAAAKTGTGAPTGFEDFAFVSTPLSSMDWRKAGKRLISRGSVATDAGIRSKQQLYVEGDVSTGSDSVFPALYATGDIALGPASELHDWAHAAGTLTLGRNSVALRRVSAGKAIRLGVETWFERLSAPAVFFGDAAAGPSVMPRPRPVVADLADLPGAVRQTPQLVIVRGDCSLPSGRSYDGSLVVTGFLSIGAGTVVYGDIKAREGISVGYQAAVQGAVTCEKRIYFFSEATALGPVISESDILLGAGSVVGQPGVQTTVSAANIIVEDGAAVHGAVWAHDIGMVKAA
ncbi:MAG: hypothetical protein JWQ72_2992 [Polaromonas sp.]|nr:hypothetical protein [Polaromonas sp.]